MKHALAVTVAVAYVALSLAEGGYSPSALAIATLIVWFAVIVGLALGGWPRGDVPSTALAAGACLAGLVLWAALSLAWASDDGRAFPEVVRAAGYVGVFALVTIASPRGSARSWLVGLAIGLGAVAALSLGSRLVPALPGGDEEIASLVGNTQGRLSYPLGYWNALASCMAVAAVLLVWLGARAESRLGRAVAVGAVPPIFLVIHLTSSRGGVIAAAVGLAMLVALGPARVRLLGGLALAALGGLALAALSGLRPAFVDSPSDPVAEFAAQEMLLATLLVASAVGLVRYLADQPLSRVVVPRALTRVAVAALAVALVGGAIAADPPERFDSFKAQPAEPQFGDAYVSNRLASASGSGRYQYWAAAFDAFTGDPLKGVGAGGYEAWWNESGSISRVITNAHSVFFDTAAELGLPGLALLLGFLAAGGLAAWRRRAARPPGGELEVAVAILVAGIFSAAIDWTWELPAAFVLVVIAVALLAGPAMARRGAVEEASRDGEPPAGGSAGRTRFAWGVATVVAGWAAIWVAGILFLTEAKLGDSREATDRGDFPAAAQDAEDAATLQPWAAEPRLQLALVEERGGNLDDARRALGEAIDRAPDDWSLWFVLSRIERKAGDRDAAEEAMARARELNPRSPLFARQPPTGGAD